MNKMIIEAERRLTVVEEMDVVVCGAGPAGVCAAIAAARTGARTFLIENAGCLGGTWTAGLLGWIIDHINKGGLLKELKNEIYSRGGTALNTESWSMPFDIEVMKLLLEEKCRQAEVRVRLHTRVVGVVKDAAGKIDAVITESKSGREAWRAKIVIDATGDGDVGFFAGCRYALGNPENGLTQPMSLLCLISGLDLEACKKYVNGYSSDWITAASSLKADLEAGGVSPSYAFPSLFLLVDGLYFLMANHQYKKLATSADDVTAATMTGRREINAQIAALRLQGGGWKNIRLVATAEHIGTREGRRLKGLYEVTDDDAMNGVRHDDAICRVTCGLDVHSLDSEHNKGIEKGKFKAQPYDIPLRALISADIPNLMMAGRCISGDFLVHSSYRVTGVAASLGEAAGVTAALAAGKGINPVAVSFAEVKAKL